MNFQAFIFIFLIITIGSNGVYASDPGKKNILQLIIEILQYVSDTWQKWVNDQQTLTTTLLPLNNSTADPYLYSRNLKKIFFDYFLTF